MLAIVAALVGCSAFNGGDDLPRAEAPADAGGVPSPPGDAGAVDGGGGDASSSDGGDPGIGANESLVDAFRFDLSCNALEKVQNATVTEVAGKVGGGCRVCYVPGGAADGTATVRVGFAAARAATYHARLAAKQASAPAVSVPSATVALNDGVSPTVPKPIAMSDAWGVSSVDASLAVTTKAYVELRFVADANTTQSECADIDTIVVTVDR